MENIYSGNDNGKDKRPFEGRKFENQPTSRDEMISVLPKCLTLLSSKFGQ